MSLTTDVRYDETAALDLLRQLVACRVAFDDARAWLAGAGRELTQDWTGPHRERFDDRLGALQRRLGEVGDDLAFAARRVAAELGEAEAEQTRRRHLRHVEAMSGGPSS